MNGRPRLTALGIRAARQDNMRSRLVVLVVTVVAAASVIFAISRFVSSSPPELARVPAAEPGLLPRRL